MSLLPAVLVSFLGAACAQYTEVPGIPYEEHLKTFAMSSDASKVMFFNNENDQIQIVSNYDWDNVVSVSVDDTGSLDGKMYAMALSSDGSKACTVADDGYVWLSSDGGMTWAKDSSLGIDEWRSVTMSPDGSKLLVCAKTGRVVLSHDAGSTWSELNGGQSQYVDCSMSADGQTIALARRSVELEVSTDGGSTFSYTSSGTTNSDDRSWNRVLVSRDGSKILLGVMPFASGGGFISSDSGATWTRPTGVSNWKDMTMSDDGSKIYVLADQECPESSPRCENPTAKIWSSSDSGSTWQEEFPDGRAYWNEILTSSDGSIVVGLQSNPWHKGWSTSTTTSTMTNTTTGTTSTSSSITTTVTSGTTTTSSSMTMTVTSTITGTSTMTGTSTVTGTTTSSFSLAEESEDEGSGPGTSS